MDRTGFTTPIVGTASVKVSTDANGNIIADNSSVVGGSKRISINNITANLNKGTATNINAVFNAFIVTLSGALASAIDELETTFTAKWIV